jgi:hypothetical protein
VFGLEISLAGFRGIWQIESVMKLNGTIPAGRNHPSDKDNLATHSGGKMESASARPVALALAALGTGLFLAGVGITAIFFHRQNQPATGLTSVGETNATATKSTNKTKPTVSLTATTVAVLQDLASPIEIRFYSLLDPKTVPDSTKDFAGRAERLTEAYQQQGNGKIKFVSTGTLSDANAKAAAADGISAFNREKGDACFLGIAVVGNGRTVSLARLTPDFEPALESDITRAIQQVAESQPPGQVKQATVTPDPEALAAVRRIIPNPDAVTVEDGASKIRQAHLNELADTVLEMETKLKAAQDAFRQAETNQSEADQQAARAQIQKLEAEKSEKLRGLFAKSQAEVEAFKFLKAAH